MVRSTNAGVFAGTVKALDGQTATLEKARRIHFWDGAASLSQLATNGTSKPQNCRFPVAVAEVMLFEVIEIIPITAEAEQSIAGVPVWEK
jgi:hypothetical protein